LRWSRRVAIEKGRGQAGRHEKREDVEDEDNRKDETGSK
jgi:hypothetical protein